MLISEITGGVFDNHTVPHLKKIIIKIKKKKKKESHAYFSKCSPIFESQNKFVALRPVTCVSSMAVKTEMLRQNLRAR